MKIQYILIITILLLVGCRTTKESINTSNLKETGQKKQVELSEDKEIEFEYLYIEGLKQKMIGNPETAIKYFNNCIDINPSSAACMFELANIYNSKNEFISAKLLLEKAIQINPDNKWYKLLLAKIYQNGNEFVKASKVYKELIKKDPDNIDYHYMNAILLSSSEKFDEAIKAYNELEEKLGFNEQISLARQHIYRSAGKNKEAYAEVEKLIQSNPSVPEYYGIMADMYKEDGEMDKALVYYNKVLEIDPQNGFVNFSLVTFYLKNNELDKAYEHAQKGFSNTNMEIDTKIQLYLMLSSTPEDKRMTDTQLEELIQLIIKAHPDDSRSYSIQADFLIQKKRPEEARDYMLKALEVNPNIYPLWEQLIITDNQIGDFDAMIEHSSKTIELFPSQPLPYVLKAVANIQNKKYKQAIESLENGQIYIGENKKMEAQFEMYKAEAYYNLNQREKAFQAYDKVIDIEPDNFMAMNNYAYYLTIKGEQLEKAEMLSGRVVQANPDNPTYLDTHAWVLFKKKEYRLAKFYMDTALKNGGDTNAVVVEHYGDILYMLNNIEGALSFWQKSLELENTSPTLLQKISAKKYIGEEE